MHNSYKNGTKAWWIMKEAMVAEDTFESALTDMACAFETACSDIDDLEQELDELTEERDQLQRDYDDAKARLDEFEHLNPELITLLTNLKTASEAMDKYCTAKLENLGALNVQESDSDSSDGTGGDDDSEVVLRVSSEPNASPRSDSTPDA